MSKNSISERILKASGAVLVAHICFKAVGFLQFFIVGSIIETQTWETVYGFAFDGVIFSLFLIGEEMIGPALLPVFSAEKDNHGEKKAWKLANTLITLQIIILGLVITVLILFPEKITSTLTYWTSRNSNYFQLAANSVSLMAPALLCFSLGSTTYILLNGYKKFFLAAFGDATWKLCILFSVALGIGVLGFNWKALAVGIILGSIAKLATHLTGLLKQLHFFRLKLDLKNPAFKTMLWLMLPLLVGIIFAKIRDFYNHITVLSALDSSGLIKANAYGRKLFGLIGTIVPYTLSIAMFPFLCDLVNQKNNQQLGELLTKSGKMLLALFIPLSLVCLVLSPPLTTLLVMGKFTNHDAYLAGISMATYTLILPAYSLEMLLMQAFFAKRKMLAITILGIIFSSLSMLISYIGIIYLKQTGATALIIVAAGFVLSRTLKTTTLIMLLKRSIPCFHLKDTIIFLSKTLVIGACCTFVTWLTFYIVDSIPLPQSLSSLSNTLPSLLKNKLPLLTKLAMAFSTSAIIFLLLAHILKLNEIKEMISWSKEKVLQKLKKQTIK